MGADLLQRPHTEKTKRVDLGQPERRPIWPFVAAGIAVLAVVIAGAALFLQDDGVPFESDAVAIENSLAGVREQGPYHLPAPQVVGSEGVSTESREGGTYAPQGDSTSVTTESREGGTYVELPQGGTTEAREGGTYAE